MKLDYLLELTVVNNASDLHVCSGIPPSIRINGDLIFLNEPVLGPDDCRSLAQEVLRSDLIKEFNEKGEVDLSYMIKGLARFRINVFKQRNSIAIAARVIPTDVPEVEKLGLPNVVYDLMEKQRGLILVTGPTGSGKSTTLASMLNYINKKRTSHIVTIEDPIEFLHKHIKCVVNQRELGSDTLSYANALRAALREDPDIILIGEMRDMETIETALTAAETGHLVLSTLHTSGAAKTIDRIIDVFPPHQQSQVRSQLSTVLQGIISQQLIKKADGNGRVLATEVMVWTPAIANLIRESRIPQINTNIHTGSQLGMHSMDSCISNLFKMGLIDYQTACKYALDQENFKKLINY
ncbi:MAG: type IV pilus twitching motility protein PilT [Bacillota bacterium]|nr:type IV pilus twitching motility protein PilT [Bacillota bacterium]